MKARHAAFNFTRDLLEFFADDLRSFHVRILTDTVKHAKDEETQHKQNQTLKLITTLQEFTEYIEEGQRSHRQPLIYFSYLLRGFVNDALAMIEALRTVQISTDDLRYIRKCVRKTFDDLIIHEVQELKRITLQSLEDTQSNNLWHIQTKVRRFNEWIDENTTEEEDRERMFNVISRAGEAEKRRTRKLWDDLRHNIDELFAASSPSYLFQLVAADPFLYILDRSKGIEDKTWDPTDELSNACPGLRIRLQSIPRK